MKYTVYKVIQRVRQDNGGYVMQSSYSPHPVKYALEAVTVPQIGGTKLFAFLDRQDAEDYLDNCSFCEGQFFILECEAEGVEETSYLLNTHLSIDTIVAAFKPDYRNYWARSFYKSAVLCNLIKPIRLVE